jgi:hypothetical protein
MRIAALLLTVAALLVAAPSALGCTLLSASAGPVDANVAGTVTVHVDPVAFDVGLEGLLGTLVCSVLGGAGGAPPLPAVPA